MSKFAFTWLAWINHSPLNYRTGNFCLIASIYLSFALLHCNECHTNLYSSWKGWNKDISESASAGEYLYVNVATLVSLLFVASCKVVVYSIDGPGWHSAGRVTQPSYLVLPQSFTVNPPTACLRPSLSWLTSFAPTSSPCCALGPNPGRCHLS